MDFVAGRHTDLVHLFFPSGRACAKRATNDYRLVIVAPTQEDKRRQKKSHALIRKMQALRGRIYLEDGAITESELLEGRHSAPADFESWHILMQDSQEAIRACVRIQVHSAAVRLSDLNVCRAAIATDGEWSHAFNRALSSELAMATLLRIPVFEVGGLALDESVRGTPAVLNLVLATYGLAKSIGGAIGFSTVTRRHHASAILRKLGGEPLTDGETVIPAYYDPQYRCEMEILKFYSWNPVPRHRERFAEMQRHLTGLPMEIPALAFSSAAAG